MKNKGFTLVELLAVIAILAILVIIALPNVMSMFNEAKKNSFSTEVKQVYKVAQQTWMSDSMFSTNEQVYSRCDTCNGKELDLTGRKEFKYYIKINKSGDVVKYYATDGTYQYSYDSNKGLLVTDIDNIQTVAELEDYEIIDIDNNNPVVPEKPHYCVSFEEDSWSRIRDNVVDGYASCYHIGDTKTVEVSGYGNHKVRISNMSTPDICSTSGFSQTACGIVFEFEDIILKRNFNPEQSNSGGWRDSDARSYLNGEFINLLPSDLRNIIVSTYAVSGHETGVSENYITNDKIYLLATAELWQKVGTSDIGYDSADTLTRQLDYYASIPVTSTSYSGAIKYYGESKAAWWLRSAHKTSNNYIGNVPTSGKTNAYYGHASLVYGLSPAFKIN